MSTPRKMRDRHGEVHDECPDCRGCCTPVPQTQRKPVASPSQAIPEAELQRVAEEIVAYISGLHNCGMLNYVNPPTIMAILRTLEKKA